MNYFHYFIDGIDADPVLAVEHSYSSGDKILLWFNCGISCEEHRRNIGPELLVPVDIVERGKQTEAQPQQPDTGDPLSLIMRGAIQAEVERQISHIIMQQPDSEQ